uniref:Immunoglobulin V-set domain-containing protein n=1 Tax=Cyprinus carpio TaxID=7962 RepID=A0A8C1ZTJ5_CYPCA
RTDNNSLTFILTECKGQTLTESESVVIKPGNNLKLTRTFSGIDVGAADISWIRQAEGKALEWISYISAPSGSNKYYSKTIEGRFTISRDNNTAVYYCTRKTVQFLGIGAVQFLGELGGRILHHQLEEVPMSAHTGTIFIRVHCQMLPDCCMQSFSKANLKYWYSKKKKKSTKSVFCLDSICGSREIMFRNSSKRCAFLHQYIVKRSVCHVIFTVHTGSMEMKEREDEE